MKFSIHREKSGSLNTWFDTKSGQEKGKYSYFFAEQYLGTFKPSSPAQFAGHRLFTAMLVPRGFCLCFSPSLSQCLSQCTQVKSRSQINIKLSAAKNNWSNRNSEAWNDQMGEKMFYFQVKIRNGKMSAKLAPSHRMYLFAATGISLTGAFQQEVLNQL